MLVHINEHNKAVYQELARAMFESGAMAGSYNSDVVEANIRTFLGEGEADGFLIEFNQSYVGYVLLSYMYSTETGAYDAWLEELYVMPSMQGLGLGSKVLDMLKDTLEPRIKRIRLEVARTNQGAIALYERKGFKKAPYDEMIYNKQGKRNHEK